MESKVGVPYPLPCCRYPFVASRTISLISVSCCTKDVQVQKETYKVLANPSKYHSVEDFHSNLLSPVPIIKSGNILKLFLLQFSLGEAYLLV